MASANDADVRYDIVDGGVIMPIHCAFLNETSYHALYGPVTQIPMTAIGILRVLSVTRE